MLISICLKDFKGIPRVLIIWCLATQVQFHWITTDRLGSGLSSGRTSSRLIQLEAGPQVIHVLKSDSKVATAHFSLPWNFAPLHSSLKKTWKIAKAHTLSVGTHSQYKRHQGCTELITPICLGPAWTLHHGIDIKKLKEFDLRKLRLHHKESSTNVFCIHVRAQVQQQ